MWLGLGGVVRGGEYSMWCIVSFAFISGVVSMPILLLSKIFMLCSIIHIKLKSSLLISLDTILFH